ncbi:MAG: DUF4331 domain-containing protein [Actinobacteria bacterium]|nr:MAG: DUF4331 domain-containing protein [Actinomycetota bacterium]REK39950.1 MAG: DUF4331 domain-containing protein [Actinomycetota bacterium]
MKRFVKGSRLAVLLIAMALVGLAAIPATLGAADHLDAPNLTSPGGDGRWDITDVYAFKNGANTVLIMGVNPAAGVFSPVTFDENARYGFEIDTDGDARDDLSFKFTFGAPDADGKQSVRLIRSDPGSDLIAEGTTGENIPVDGGGTLRAGLFDDPFFFDLNAFLGAYPFCEAPGGPAGSSGEDFFAGLNVTAIVLEVPSDSLGPDNIGVWARTGLGRDQVDRMGRPAINTVFIPSDQKDAFNEASPRQDAKRFGQFLGDLAPVLLPDILTVDTSSDAGFLNGRQLADDVIDIELQVITGDPAAGDCVDGNDVAFPGAFPYLADPHQ